MTVDAKGKVPDYRVIGAIMIKVKCCRCSKEAELDGNKERLTNQIWMSATADGQDYWSCYECTCIAFEEMEAFEELYQTAETLTHLHHRPRPSKPPISHWTTVRFCNGCPSGGVRA